MLMRLFSSSDKHSLQKIRSQHLIQVNLVVDQMQIKRLRERIEFAVNQLRQAISEQKETINHSFIYIQKACDESIENSIQKQIDQLQS